jgi:adenylate cyclase
LSDASTVSGRWPRHPGPVIDWLIDEARSLPDAPAVLSGLAGRLVESGLPLVRASFHFRPLHPQLFGMGFYWRRGEDRIERTRAEHGIELTSTFRESPMRALIEGAGAVRQRLDLPAAELPMPLFRQLRAEGLTDYVALPLRFGYGRVQGTTWASDRPGGFSTLDLDRIEDLLPLYGLLLESRLARESAAILLDTYVGHNAGERILAGQIQRGLGETVRAAIWFCDLRGFTALSQEMPRDDLLALLNDYFDVMAGAVEAHDGEIVKFIGDGMLAMFPLETDAACWRAVEAARTARKGMTALNARRREAGAPALGYGIALHTGEVMYGNIGARGRLDFTVLGPAVNLAARIEGLSRTLGYDVLISGEFAGLCSSAFRRLGHHRLPGIADEVDIFTLSDPE